MILFSGCATVPTAVEMDERVDLESSDASIRASAIVRYKGRNGKESGGKAVIVATKPDLFRIEVKGPFGVMAVLLVSDGRGLYTYSNGRSNYTDWSGSIPFSITGSEMVDFLMGFRGLDGDTTNGNTSFAVEKDGDGRVVRVTRKKTGGREVTTLLGDYKELYGMDFPHRLSLNAAGASLSVEYRRIEFGVEPNYAIFDISELPGM